MTNTNPVAIVTGVGPRAGELETKRLEPILHNGVGAHFPRAFAHFARLREHPAFAADLAPYLKKFEPALSECIATD